MEDVVVVGRRNPSTGVVTIVGVNPRTDSTPIEAYDQGGSAQTGSTTVNINVSVANSANKDKAVEAAQNVAQAVAIIISEGMKLSPSTPIRLPNGQTMTAGNLVDQVMKTKFVITDQTSFNNPGVGQADRNTMTDRLNYASFVVGSGGSYADTGWQGQGVIGIILHEIGHMTPDGYSNYIAERAAFTRENRLFGRNWVKDDFWHTDYHRDNEAFAHDFSISVANLLGIPIDIYTSGTASSYRSYLGPQQIYNINTGSN